MRKLQHNKVFHWLCLASILGLGGGYGNSDPINPEIALFQEKPLDVFGVHVAWVTDPAKGPEDAGDAIFEASGNHYEFMMPEGELQFYINKVFFVIKPPKDNFLRVLAIPQGDHYAWDAQPHEPDKIMVSQACPVTLNHYKFSISERAESFRDGTMSPALIVLDKTTAKEERLPAVQGTRASLGRFTLYVTSSHLNTNTVGLLLSAEPDLTVKGKGAYYSTSDLSDLASTSLKNWLSELGKRYGFETTWSFPEELSGLQEEWMSRSVRFGDIFQNYDRSHPSDIHGVVQELIGRFEQFFHLSLVFTWNDNEHLVISAKNPEELIAEHQHEKKVTEETERLKQVLETDYSFDVQIYSLETLDAETAVKLIQPELRTYALRISDGTNEGLPYISDYMQIRAPREPGKTIDKKEENVIADQRSNSLIVVALPKTHKRVANILLNMDRLNEATQKAAPTFFRIEAVLLRGVEAGKNRASIADASFQGLDTKVESLQIQDQTMRDLAALLSEYSKTNINVASPVDSSLRVTLNVQKPLTIRDVFRLLEELYPIRVTVSSNSILIHSTKKETHPPQVKDPKDYGISEEDLTPFGVQAVEEVGKGSLQVVDEPGETGSASILLGDSYQVKLQYVDTRDPYLIVRGGVSRQQTQGNSLPLVESTLFLKSEEPSLLGVTNLREALMLVVTLKEE